MCILMCIYYTQITILATCGIIYGCVYVYICLCMFAYICIYRYSNPYSNLYMDFIPILLMRKHVQETGKRVIQDPKARGASGRMPRLCAESPHTPAAVFVKCVWRLGLPVASKPVGKT